ncbi:hypothetical protein F0919_11275 [Taibaiella lutea]|uniref:DUF4157 domain-containing protein n=1 Tax=Taibaiella lutea TaxID=2608001 RepID=A0A5M6CD72_9BACT|nr:hypothetical protein [Taibaiella lutea]KAA5533128.1 hypothetical protein F0919_11275 [Taibaiella lutea]
MKNKILFFLLVSFLATYSHAGIVKQFPFQDCTIELLDSKSAAEATNHSDDYTKALTSFDLQIRLGRKENVAEKDYLNLAASQALTWDEEDQQKLQQSFQEIEKFLESNKIHLNLPKKIQLLKTAGAEEFGAEGYTRENRIMLCVKGGQEINTHVVAHELFHVFSRFNADTRNKIYAIFGFQKCNRINTATAMDNRVITNPDCPFTEHFIALNIGGKDRHFALQLYSTKPFEENFSLQNANIALLELENKNKQETPLIKDGKGVLLQLDEVPELFTKIGKNTFYVLHPEEISAEHFSMWIIAKKVPQPEFFDKMKEVLSEAK